MSTLSNNVLPESILLYIPEEPPVPAVPGLLIFCQNGTLTIRQGTCAERSTELTFDLGVTSQISEAVLKGLQQKLFLPVPEGKEPGWWEREGLQERSLQFFGELRAMLRGEDKTPPTESKTEA